MESEVVNQTGNILMPAGMLANAGFNVVVFDLRDHGESSIEDDSVSAGQDEWVRRGCNPRLVNR